MDPATIGIAISVVQGIRSATRGDGGLGGSLGAINGKLDLVINQLASIQRSLEYIIAEIRKLANYLKDVIEENTARELCNQLQTAIEKIIDLKKEADRRGVSLEPNNPDRGDFPERFKQWFFEFDKSRGELTNWPHGAGNYPSMVAPMCIAISSIAFGYGFISKEKFIDDIDDHIDWLKDITNPDHEHSSAWEIRDSHEKEAKVIEKLESDASNRDFAAHIAALAYRSPLFYVPMKTRMITYWFADGPIPGEQKAGESSLIIMMPRLRRIDDSRAGPILHVDLQPQNDTDCGLYPPHGSPLIFGEAVKTIRENDCWSLGQSPDLQIDRATCRQYKWDQCFSPSDVWRAKDFVSYVFQQSRLRRGVWKNFGRRAAVRESIASNSERLAAETNPKRKKGIQESINQLQAELKADDFVIDHALDRLLDVNKERLMQAYSQACIDATTEHLEIVKQMRAQFPEIPRGEH